jgi:hypothetical protein
MTTRAIAAATGVSKSAVNRELSGVPFGTPEPDDVIDSELVDDEEKRVIGLDGRCQELDTLNPPRSGGHPLGGCSELKRARRRRGPTLRRRLGQVRARSIATSSQVGHMSHLTPTTTSAIAAGIGISKNTVKSDLNKVAPVEPPDEDVIDAEIVDDEEVEEERVTGTSSQVEHVFHLPPTTTRAIAAAAGVGVGTVHRDLSGVQNRTPEPDDDQGHCGWHRG